MLENVFELVWIMWKVVGWVLGIVFVELKDSGDGMRR